MLAIEVKQYTDASGTLQTIVPGIIGDTETAKQTKRGRGRAPIDRDRLLTALHDVSADAERAASALLDWAEEQLALGLAWKARTANVEIAENRPRLRIWSDGRLEVHLENLRRSTSTWDAARCDDLVRKLETIEDLQFDPGRRWPKASIEPLADPQKA